jgi:hypothetical protein
MQAEKKKKKKKKKQQLLRIGDYIPPHQEALKALEPKESGGICPSRLLVDPGHEEGWG